MDVFKKILLILFFAGLVCSGYAQRIREVSITDVDRKQLDPFEQQNLARADKLFDDKQYRAAAAEYDAFLLEFPQSAALPYALLRKSRSIHLDNKRFQAIKSYQEVLDYFPNRVDYAAPALYYIGDCHWENGDVRNAVIAWRRMADDPQYSRNYLACNALVMLAENFERNEDFPQAMRYFSQAASTFRRSNPDVARNAMQKVVDYYFRIQPNLQRLRQFFSEAQGFSHHAQNLPEDEAEVSRLFWRFVVNQFRRYGDQFRETEDNARKAFYSYWAKVMHDLYPDWDDFQFARIESQYRADGNQRNKFRDIDRFMKRPENRGNQSTIIKAIRLCEGNTEKMNEYYAMLDFDKLDNDLKINLVFVLIGLENFSMARNAFARIDLANMTDAERRSLMRRLWEPTRQGLDEECIVRTGESFTNLDNGRMELMEFYYRHRTTTEAAPLVEYLRQNPAHASRALYLLGIMYQRESKFEEAITTLHDADNPPDNLFRIVDCYDRLDRLNMAAETTIQIENFFPGSASRAALRRAYLYRDAKMEDQYIAGLRHIMNKYPKSSQSSTAHVELQRLGVDKVGGGVAAEK